jgi:hypothetical protein
MVRNGLVMEGDPDANIFTVAGTVHIVSIPHGVCFAGVCAEL